MVIELEVALKQQPVVIYYGLTSSEYGRLLIATTDVGLCWVALGNDLDGELALLAKAWPKASMIEDVARVESFKTEIFATDPNLKLHIQGTRFQLAVWRALLTIKRGQTLSYSDIAYMIENPKANQAVGNAVGANPIGVVIPCHRVLPKHGAIGGYRFGAALKARLLDCERQSAIDQKTG